MKKSYELYQLEKISQTLSDKSSKQIEINQKLSVNSLTKVIKDKPDKKNVFEILSKNFPLLWSQ